MIYGTIKFGYIYVLIIYLINMFFCIYDKPLTLTNMKATFGYLKRAFVVR